MKTMTKSEQETSEALEYEGHKKEAVRLLRVAIYDLQNDNPQAALRTAALASAEIVEVQNSLI